jgi:hypothetical protein
MGVISPGALPLIMNLVRSYDSSVSAETAITWKDQSEWSMGNELYSFNVPSSLIGKPFLHCAWLYRRATVSVIGVVDGSGKVLLNPKGFIVTAETRLLAIAADESIVAAESKRLADDAADATRSLGKELEEAISLRAVTSQTFGVLPSTKRTGGRKPQAAVVRLALSDEILHSLTGHVVLIDLHSAHRQDIKSPQAAADSDVYRATDLFNMMRSIKLQDAAVQILLLSRGSIHPSFDELWRDTGYDPIYHVDGCGLNFEHLKACRVYIARGALVFSTAESADEDADIMTMLVTASIDDLVHELGPKQPDFNVVSDIRHMESLTLVPPFYTDDAMTQLAAENFAFEPAFVVGRVICSPMLDSALYQAYFNPEVLRTVDAFIYGNGRSASISSMPVPQECQTYYDLEMQCSRLGFLPIALSRVIEDQVNTELRGYRFMLVNPHSSCVIRETDHVYFLV